MTHREQKLPFSMNYLVKWFLAIIMIGITFLTFYQVVMRYVINNAPSWAEELVRFLFIWCTFIAAAIGIEEKIHIGIDVVVNLLPSKIQKSVEILVYAALIVFSGYLIYYGWKISLTTKNQPSPALGLPMFWVYLSIPVAGCLNIYYCLKQMRKNFSQIVE